MIIQDALLTMKLPKKMKQMIIIESKKQNIACSELLRRMIFDQLVNTNKSAR